eukprot:scaffold7626_cov159-Amphora_coffeaeformis.AAC.3
MAKSSRLNPQCRCGEHALSNRPWAGSKVVFPIYFVGLHSHSLASALALLRDWEITVARTFSCCDLYLATHINFSSRWSGSKLCAGSIRAVFG